MEMKKCSKCGEEKELTAEYWHRQKRSKDGFKARCKECIKEDYQENREHILQQKKDYYQENKIGILEKDKAYYQNNREKILERNNKYYQNNKKEILEQVKEYYQANKEKIAEYKKQYSQKNKEKIREHNRQYYNTYYQLNKEKYIINDQKRRARKAQLPNTLTTEEYENTLEYFNHSCAYCGCELNKDNHHMEHVVPVSKGGGTTQKNIIPSCASCNSSKHTKTLADFYRYSDDFSIERLTQIAKYLAQFTDWVVSSDE